MMPLPWLKLTSQVTTNVQKFKEQTVDAIKDLCKAIWITSPGEGALDKDADHTPEMDAEQVSTQLLSPACHRLDAGVQAALLWFQREQRGFSSVAPNTLRKDLTIDYWTARDEKGTGCDRRQKEVMQTAVEGKVRACIVPWHMSTHSLCPCQSSARTSTFFLHIKEHLHLDSTLDTIFVRKPGLKLPK